MPNGFYFDSLSLSTKQLGWLHARIAGCYRLDSKSIFSLLDSTRLFSSHIARRRVLTWQESRSMSDFYLFRTSIRERPSFGTANSCCGILP
jgi:hypothetical protein